MSQPIWSKNNSEGINVEQASFIFYSVLSEPSYLQHLTKFWKNYLESLIASDLSLQMTTLFAGFMYLFFSAVKEIVQNKLQPH